jgi:hypothetical protein
MFHNCGSKEVNVPDPSGSEPRDFLDRKSAVFSAGSFFMLTELVNHVNVIKNFQDLPQIVITTFSKGTNPKPDPDLKLEQINPLPH